MTGLENSIWYGGECFIIYMIEEVLAYVVKVFSKHVLIQIRGRAQALP